MPHALLSLYITQVSLIEVVYVQFMHKQRYRANAAITLHNETNSLNLRYQQKQRVKYIATKYTNKIFLYQCSVQCTWTTHRWSLKIFRWLVIVYVDSYIKNIAVIPRHIMLCCLDTWTLWTLLAEFVNPLSAMGNWLHPSIVGYAFISTESVKSFWYSRKYPSVRG